MHTCKCLKFSRESRLTYISGELKRFDGVSDFNNNYGVLLLQHYFHSHSAVSIPVADYF